MLLPQNEVNHMSDNIYSNQEEIIQVIKDTKIIAIVRGLDGGYAELARALYDGGVRAMEITFNQKNPDSFKNTAEGISDIVSKLNGEMIAGAGTVTSTELVKIAYDAGAQFIVSPDCNPEVIKYTKQLGMLSMPGAFTPTEILTAHNCGADFVKVFPAGNLGPEYIKAIRGPLNHIRLLAVGGVDEKNVKSFIDAGCIGAGCGGKLINKEWIKNGEFDKITKLAREFIENAR